MYKIGFDNDKYLKMQSSRIRERISEFGGKLYLEFGGKLFDDFHASRVLPGFEPDSKLQMLLQLKDEAEIVIVVSAEDIEKCKVRSDLGITYDVDALRLAKAFSDCGLVVGSIVLTKYAPQPRVLSFEKRLKAAGIPVYHHYLIEKRAVRRPKSRRTAFSYPVGAGLPAQRNPASKTYPARNEKIPASATRRDFSSSLTFRRKERDSNPRSLSAQRFSRPPQSTTLPSFRA